VSYQVDGNAIGGDLFAAFSREMTTVVGRCRKCGTASAVAELSVYPRAPGTVARCSSCDAVVMCWSQSAVNATFTCRLSSLTSMSTHATGEHATSLRSSD
jgi:hypothetical protein